MKSLVCDICGAEVEHGFIYNGGYSHKSETFKIKIWDSGIRKLDICSRCANKIRIFVEEDYLTKDEIKEIIDKEKVPNNNDDNVVWNNALTYIAKQFDLAMKSKK